MSKVEPKVHFANERTFLSWMHMSVSDFNTSAHHVCVCACVRCARVCLLFLVSRALGMVACGAAELRPRAREPTMVLPGDARDDRWRDAQPCAESE